MEVNKGKLVSIMIESAICGFFTALFFVKILKNISDVSINEIGICVLFALTTLNLLEKYSNERKISK